MKKIFTRIGSILGNPLVFLLISALIIQSSIIWYNNREVQTTYEEEIEEIKLEELIKQQKNHTYREMTQVAKDYLNEELHKCMLKYSNFLCIKTVNYDVNVTQYEMIYYGGYERYKKSRDTELEDEVKTFSLDLLQIWKKYGFEDRVVRILMLCEDDTELAYFDVENGLLTFSIHDAIKTETTKEDWIFLFEYLYEYEPTDKELERFIETQTITIQENEL